MFIKIDDLIEVMKIGAKFRVGRKVKIDDEVFIIAMVSAYCGMAYNLININTGDCWFALAVDQGKFISAIKELESDYGFEFID